MADMSFYVKHCHVLEWEKEVLSILMHLALFSACMVNTLLNPVKENIGFSLFQTST